MGLSKERGLYFQEKWEEMEYRFANIEMKKEIEELKLELSGYRQAILQDKEMLGLKEENEQLHSIIKEVREYITSYESISIMQGLMNEYSNYDLDVKTMNEMIRRYMVVHDELLKILDKENKQ